MGRPKGPRAAAIARLLVTVGAQLLAVHVALAATPAPLGSTGYIRTFWSGNPDDPGSPDDPDDPEDPDDPADPDDPEDPDEPEDSDEPEDPDEPDAPEDPDQPDDLEEPGQPDEADSPDDPDSPDGSDDGDGGGSDGQGGDGSDGGEDDGGEDDGGSDDGDDNKTASGTNQSGDDPDDNSGDDGDSSPSGSDDEGEGEDEDDDVDAGDDSSASKSDDNGDDDGGDGVGGAASGGAGASDDVSEVDDPADLLEPAVIEKDTDGFDYRRGEIIAIDLDPAALEAATEAGFEVVLTFDADTIGARVYLLRSDNGLAMPEAIALLKRTAPGASLAPNHLFYAPSADGTPKPALPPRPAAPCDCRVGMLDTAVDPLHPSLAGVRVQQRAFLSDRVQPAAHGTGVASLMFGRESGLSELYVADVFSGGGSRSGAATSVIKGLEWLAGSGVPVINISLAGPSNPVVETILRRLAAKGTIIVAAVGNDGPAAPPAYPAALPQVVAVTAVDSEQRIYRYAVRGDHVDFAAPGVQVVAAGLDGRYVEVTGTSFAAPVVAGRIAAAARRGSASTAVQDLQRRAQDLGAPGRDRIFGFGLIRPEPQ